MLLGFSDAGESLRYQGAFQVGGRSGGGKAGCAGEGVDEAEDEEAGEGAAEVGDSGVRC